MPTLKYLFRLAGPKILTLLALAVAKTVLSNRLARLQVCQLSSSCWMPIEKVEWWLVRPCTQAGWQCHRHCK